MYKILDLFSGIGGFSLGLERTGHFKTTAFCEIDKFCKLILDKHWKGTKIYDNVKEITKERLEADGIEFPDIITGGFPCQSFSVAGKQKGTSDDRYLWPEMFRIIKIFKPRYVIGENVRGIVNIENGMVFETVCSNLEDEGYEVQPFLIPAASVGAPHRRERIWFIAIREESVVDTTTFDSNNIMKPRKPHPGGGQVPPLNQQVMWATPNTMDYLPQRSKEALLRQATTTRKGRTRPANLREQVDPETVRMWRTPDAHCNRGPSSSTRMKMKLEKKMPISINDQVAHPNLMWPTPRASGQENPESLIKRKGARAAAQHNLTAAVQMMPTPTSTERSGINPKTGKGAGLSKTIGGSLNPTWVEWLMGYPAGYTDLKHWEILSSRKSSKK